MLALVGAIGANIWNPHALGPIFFSPTPREDCGISMYTARTDGRANTMLTPANTLGSKLTLNVLDSNINDSVCWRMLLLRLWAVFVPYFGAFQARRGVWTGGVSAVRSGGASAVRPDEEALVHVVALSEVYLLRWLTIICTGNYLSFASGFCSLFLRSLQC